jgi:hypothetical protein
MFHKEIEFSSHEDYFSLKEDYPTPIKLNIPEWYKELNSSIEFRTVKSCMPFLDTLTSGYLLKTPQDIKIKHNIDNENQGGEKFKDAFQAFPLSPLADLINEKKINLNYKVESHNKMQLGNSPLVLKNKNLNFHKIMNPWKIKTPKGYSCLFVPPLNNSDDRFSIISGIVDTDSHELEINFPIVINGDKYSMLDTIIKKGTPYVQIIPFKRDSWKMKIKPRSQKEIIKTFFRYHLSFMDFYKKNYWNKKLWK